MESSNFEKTHIEKPKENLLKKSQIVKILVP
nr:MAG TPA: hypothetical protein [Caudoviricetes sp.]